MLEVGVRACLEEYHRHHGTLDIQATTGKLRDIRLPPVITRLAEMGSQHRTSSDKDKGVDDGGDKFKRHLGIDKAAWSKGIVPIGSRQEYILIHLVHLGCLESTTPG